MSDGEVVRDAAGRWLKPPKGGRPRGSSQSELVRKLIEPHRAALVDRALEISKSTDPHAATSAIRLLMERLAPTPKTESEKVEVPGLADAPTFTQKCEAVLIAVADGEVSAEAGERILRLLEIFRKAREHDDVIARLDALEAGRASTVVDQVPAARAAEDFS